MPERIQNKKLVPVARSLRRNMTKEERHLWYDYLRDYPVRFSRQKVFGSYVLDFYCAKAKLAVEVDGGGHYDPETMAYDAQRTSYLEGRGLKVLRIPNNEVNHRFEGVCEHIDRAVRTRLEKE